MNRSRSPMYIKYIVRDRTGTPQNIPGIGRRVFSGRRIIHGTEREFNGDLREFQSVEPGNINELTTR